MKPNCIEMIYMMKLKLCIIGILMSGWHTYGQYKEYNSLEEALKTPQEVRYLRLRNLTEVPKEILKLPNLEALNLERNKLVVVPDWIGELTKLKALNLYGNALTELPTSIGDMEALEILMLKKNKLTTLPKTIGKLQKLKVLLEV